MNDEPNDIQATGRCSCAGCIGMGPCDLDPPRPPSPAPKPTSPQPLIDAAKTWRAQFAKPAATKLPRMAALIAAVDALPPSLGSPRRAQELPAPTALCILGPTREPATIAGDIATPRVLAALDQLGWPDDRGGSAHVEPDGWELTGAGHYYALVEDVIRAADAAGQCPAAPVESVVEPPARPAEGYPEGDSGSEAHGAAETAARAEQAEGRP